MNHEQYEISKVHAHETRETNVHKKVDRKMFCARWHELTTVIWSFACGNQRKHEGCDKKCTIVGWMSRKWWSRNDGRRKTLFECKLQIYSKANRIKCIARQLKCDMQVYFLFWKITNISINPSKKYIMPV